MTDFHDLQLKEQLLLQQKWEDDVDVDEGNVCDFCVRSFKPNKFFDQTPVGTHRDEPVGTHRDEHHHHHLLRFNKSNQANQLNQSNQNQRTRPAEPSKPSQ